MLNNRVPRFRIDPFADINTVRMEKSTRLKPAMGVIIGYIAMLLYLLSPSKYNFPAVVVSIVSFVIVQLIWPECRPKTDNLLCPLNMSQILFGAQLILLPIAAMFLGFSEGSLPWLPSDLAINVALLINTVAYLSFFGSYHYFSRKKQNIRSDAPLPQVKPHYPFRPMGLIVLVYVSIGLLGFFLYFVGLNEYINYISSPTYKLIFLDSLTGTLRGAASNFLRPFLGFSLILVWSLWVDKGKSPRWQMSALITGIVIVMLVFVNISFSYNRGAVFGPILAIVAAFSVRARRLSFKFLAIAGCLLIGIGLIWGGYRTTDLFISDLIIPEKVSSLVADLDIIQLVQVYGASPQFMGFFLEQMGLGSQLYWGKTLLSSLLYPLPILGKPFRSTSGVALYNLSIYGYPEKIDQIVPFQGELFINFHVIGVIAGYILLGYLTVKLQRAFENAHNTFETFSLFYFAIWLLFLIGGSIAVTSQIYIYFFWPIYIYFLLPRVRIRKNF
jgi:hypothetical protein